MGQTATTSTQVITSSTWIDSGDKGNEKDDTALTVRPDAGGIDEAVALLSFQIADPATFGIPSNAILRQVHVQVARNTAGPSAGVGQVCFLNQPFTENQANWYGPHDASSTTGNLRLIMLRRLLLIQDH